MPVHQLGHLADCKQFTDWSNNTWQMGIPPRETPRKVSIVTQLQSIQLTLYSRCRVPLPG